MDFTNLFLILFQDDYQDALDKLQLTVTKAYRVNSNIKFEVFIHKVNYILETFRGKMLLNLKVYYYTKFKHKKNCFNLIRLDILM